LTTKKHIKGATDEVGAAPPGMHHAIGNTESIGNGAEETEATKAGPGPESKRRGSNNIDGSIKKFTKNRRKFPIRNGMMRAAGRQ